MDLSLADIKEVRTDCKEAALRLTDFYNSSSGDPNSFPGIQQPVQNILCAMDIDVKASDIQFQNIRREAPFIQVLDYMSRYTQILPPGRILRVTPESLTKVLEKLNLRHVRVAGNDNWEARPALEAVPA